MDLFDFVVLYVENISLKSYGTGGVLYFELRRKHTGRGQLEQGGPCMKGRVERVCQGGRLGEEIGAGRVYLSVNG